MYHGYWLSASCALPLHRYRFLDRRSIALIYAKYNPRDPLLTADITCKRRRCSISFTLTGWRSDDDNNECRSVPCCRNAPICAALSAQPSGALCNGGDNNHVIISMAHAAVYPCVSRKNEKHVHLSSSSSCGWSKEIASEKRSPSGPVQIEHSRAHGVRSAANKSLKCY